MEFLISDFYHRIYHLECGCLQYEISFVDEQRSCLHSLVNGYFRGARAHIMGMSADHEK